MSTLVSLFIGLKRKIALVAEKAVLEIHFVEDFELCPFGLAASAYVFFAFFFRDGVALDGFVDCVDAPFYGVNGGAIVDEVISAVYWSLLTLFRFRSSVSKVMLVWEENP